MRFCKICGLEFDDGLVKCPECGWIYKKTMRKASEDIYEEYEYEKNETGIKITKYCGSKEIVRLEIPTNYNGQMVTELAPFLFQKYHKLEELVLPEQLKKIGSNCFEGCKSLKEISIPRGVRMLGIGVFENCTELMSVEFSSAIKNIPEKTFRNCSKLKKIMLPSEVESIGNNCFQNCKNLREFVMPEELLTVGEECFSGCFGLETVTFNKKIKCVEKETFYKCANLKKIRFPLNIISVKEKAFMGCINLEKVVCSIALKSIENDAFISCVALKEIYILNDRVEIGKNVFTNQIRCSSKKSRYVYTFRKLDGSPDYRYNPQLEVYDEVRLKYTSLEKLTIYCNEKSSAEAYAKKNKIKYNYID